MKEVKQQVTNAKEMSTALAVGCSDYFESSQQTEIQECLKMEGKKDGEENTTNLDIECTQGDPDPEPKDCNIPFASASQTRSCYADGKWGGYGICTVNVCFPGYIQSGNQCIEEISKPISAFTFTATEGETPFQVGFDASGSTDSDGEIISYNWSTSDGQSNSGKTTNFTFTEIGTHTITLKVTDNDGLTATHSTQITVSEKLRFHWSGEYTITEGGGRYTSFYLTGQTFQDTARISFAENFEENNLRLDFFFGGNAGWWEACEGHSVDPNNDFNLQTTIRGDASVTFTTTLESDGNRNGTFVAITDSNQTISGVWSVTKKEGLFGKCLEPIDSNSCVEKSAGSPYCLKGCSENSTDQECRWNNN